MPRRHAHTLAPLAIISVALAAPGPTRAQQVANAADVQAALDSVFAEYDRTNSPGCAVGVIHDGRLVYARGYGMANLDLGSALAPSSVFRIASTSKQFTAAVMVLAEQEGVLSLDDDVRKWLPELPAYESPITIRMLLHHTSGIRDYLTLTWLSGLRDEDWFDDREALGFIARQSATNFAPGTEHLYSNSGYFLISQIIRRATGSSLREYADEHIFRPLGMTRTHFHDDHTEIVPDRATGYAPDGDGFRISVTTLDMVGDGGVFTTVEDLAKWDRNFYEPRVGGPALPDALLTRGVLASGDTLDYAFGLAHGEYRGLPLVAHGGAFVGYRAELMRFPEQRLSVACLCNLAGTDPTGLSRRVAELFLGAFMTPAEALVAEGGSAGTPRDDEPAVALSNAQLMRWVGAYRDSASGRLARVETADGRLVLQMPGTRLGTYPLRALSEIRFRAADATPPIEFRFEGSAGARRITGRQNDNRLTFLEIEEVTPDQARAYAGRYHSDELDVDYVIEVDGADLVLRIARREPEPLVPTVERTFRFDSSVDVVFEPFDGRPAAFTVNAGRVRGIRFVRVEDAPRPGR